MRLFVLQRHEDATGVSGTGVVAEGIQFGDKRCAMRWVANDIRSTVVYDSIEDVKAIHGHDGKTEVIYSHWTDHWDMTE